MGSLECRVLSCSPVRKGNLASFALVLLRRDAVAAVLLPLLNLGVAPRTRNVTPSNPGSIATCGFKIGARSSGLIAEDLNPCVGEDHHTDADACTRFVPLGFHFHGGPSRGLTLVDRSALAVELMMILP